MSTAFHSVEELFLAPHSMPCLIPETEESHGLWHFILNYKLVELPAKHKRECKIFHLPQICHGIHYSHSTFET